ncbi:unnamed protein product [Closterium sp. Yama58-4]|nr:unnamed protein product [Closterium sp. Yama58-4]
MVRPLSDMWKHVVKEVGPKGNIIATCIHCNKGVTASATRIKEHLLGTPRGQDKNVTSCASAVALQLREAAALEAASSGRGSAHGSTSTVEILPARRARQQDIRDMADTGARAQLDYLWAAAVAENDWAFHTSSSKAVQDFVDAAVAFGKAYDLPSPFRVGGALLQKLKVDNEELVRPMKESWSTSGCTLSVDGWTCLKSRGLVCVIAHNDTAPVIVDIVDSKTSKKTGEYLAALIKKSITTVGANKVVQVVMDNASNNKRASDILRVPYPSVFFTNCAAHTLDLMLHDMGNIPAVKRVLSQVHRVVMMVKGSASAVTLFEQLLSKLSLVRPGATRFGTQVIMLTRFLEVKKALREMVISDEWEGIAVAQKEEGKAVRDLLLDDVFWDCGTAVLRLMTPVYEVLRTVDTRALVMGQVYGLMLEATVKTSEAAEAAGELVIVLLFLLVCSNVVCFALHFPEKYYLYPFILWIPSWPATMMVKRTSLLAAKDKPAFMTSIRAIIAKRWDGQLHNALHALGWLLNPRNQYSEEVRNDAEVRRGAEEVFEARAVDVAQRALLTVQLAQFHKGEDRLGSDEARWAATHLVECGRLTDAECWFMYGGEVKQLQSVAVMTLSQPDLLRSGEVLVRHRTGAEA